MRLLMISNQVTAAGHAGFREAYAEMERTGELASFRYVTPAITIATRGLEASLAELWREGESLRPTAILIATPGGFDHEPSWIRRFLRGCGDPAVIYYEGDSWGGRSKPISRSMSAWLAAADIVFTVAREPHQSLFRRHGAEDVRFIPHTYCQVLFGEAERSTPWNRTGLPYDAVIIGSRLAHWGRISRLPGAVQRATLVKRLQRHPKLRLAVYGAGWSGPAAHGELPYGDQTAAIREGLMSVNWDHFPGHESYASDRLPIRMIAGRVHVTTSHPGFEWLPGPDTGLFLEPSISAVVWRVGELVEQPPEQVLELGIAAHARARGRLSHREAARFMLAPLDGRLLEGLPAEPWHGFASDWSRAPVASDRSHVRG